MPDPENALQIDMFTGERVDTRTKTQKQRDRERNKPQQVAMFNTQQVIEQGRSRFTYGPMLNRRGERLELSLMIQDPRTEEEIEADRMKAAERQTVPLFSTQKEVEARSGLEPRFTFPSGLSFPLIEVETEENNRAVRLEDGVELLLYTTRKEAYERARDSHHRLLNYRTQERGSDQLEIWLPDESGYYLITYCSSKEMIDDIAWFTAPEKEKPASSLATLAVPSVLFAAANLEQLAKETRHEQRPGREGEYINVLFDSIILRLPL